MSEERMVVMRPVRVYLICDCGGEMRRLGGPPSSRTYECILCNTVETHAYRDFPHTEYVREPNTLGDYTCHSDKKDRCVRSTPWHEDLVEFSTDLKKWMCKVCKREVVPPEQAAHELPRPKKCKHHPEAPLNAGESLGEWSCAVCGRLVV